MDGIDEIEPIDDMDGLSDVNRLVANDDADTDARFVFMLVCVCVFVFVPSVCMLVCAPLILSCVDNERVICTSREVEFEFEFESGAVIDTAFFGTGGDGIYGCNDDDNDDK